jgi:PAS domain S-box-containing protein
VRRELREAVVRRENRLASEALRRSEERFRRLVETAHEGVWELDENGNTVYANQRMAEMLDREPEELLGRRFADFVSEDSRQAWLEEWEGRKRGEKGRYDLSFVRRDGALVKTIASAAPKLDESGAFVGSFAMFVDITDRKEMEEALRRERTLLEKVFGSNPYGIIIYSRTGQTLRSNASFERLFGAIPTPDYSIFEDPVLERYGLREQVARSLDGQAVSLPPLWYNAAWVSPQYPDKLICIKLDLVPLLDEHGRVEQIVVMTGDVTESKRLEEELWRAKEAAEAADRAKTEFLSIASHELRTPLTPLTLLLRRSRRRLAQGIPIGEEPLIKMERQVRRLTTLTEGLLDASRLVRGVVVLDRRRTDLRELFSQVVDDFRTQAPDRPLTLELPANPVEAMVDSVRIEQVLANLLDNAVRYTPAGSPIEVAMIDEGASIRATVTDHGPGIPDPIRTRLLSGVLVADSRPTRQAGLGLGLYIANNLVQLHGGSLGFQTELGKGSTFFFTLPRWPTGTGELEAAQPAPP